MQFLLEGKYTNQREEQDIKYTKLKNITILKTKYAKSKKKKG